MTAAPEQESSRENERPIKGIENLVIESAEMKRVIRSVAQVGPADAGVLLLGEGGVGKEVVARLLHLNSPRVHNRFVVIDCGTTTDAEAEAQLFGDDKNPFAKPDQRKESAFRTARGGTLFLDEIGELSLSLQAKLIRTLEASTIIRLGGTQANPTEVRLIAATGLDLKALVKTKEFREDLFYRINAVTIIVPPLRARPEDIPALARRFVAQFSSEKGRVMSIAPPTMDLLARHPWPGNIRQLRNAIQSACALADGDILSPGHFDLDWNTSIGAKDFDERQETVRKFLTRHDQISSSDYQGMTGTSARTAARDLTRMVKEGLLVKSSSGGRSTSYQKAPTA